jgi:hypothetical protein
LLQDTCLRHEASAGEEASILTSLEQLSLLSITTNFPVSKNKSAHQADFNWF